MIQLIPPILAIIFFISMMVSFRKIHRSQGILEFIYHWGFPVGAFVWEDLFVISLYGFIGSLATFFSGQLRIGILFFLIFWIVRSTGETIYFFLQQFFVPKHPPHNIEAEFTALKKIFGNVSHQQCLIIMQVTHQIVVMLSLIGFVLLMLTWK